MISKVANHFRMEEDNGVVTVWIDVAGSSMNVFNSSVIERLEDVVTELESSTADAVIFRSAKPSGFFAGADVKQIAQLSGREEVSAVVARGQKLFARIERLPMPTIAAIHGPCLGGGLEFALACSQRIALDSSATRLGLPEVQLGLIPGWGGSQRLPKRIGLIAALPMILQGKKLTAAQALKAGLIHAVAKEADWEATLSRRSTFSKPANGLRRRLEDSYLGRWFILRTAEKKIARDSKNYPALAAALTAVRAGFDRRCDGFAVERDEFTKLIETPTCRNLLTLFLWREEARNLNFRSSTSLRREDSTADSRPRFERQMAESHDWQNMAEVSGGGADGHDEPAADGRTSRLGEVDQQKLRTIGIIGAGAMGAGIGQLAALKGYDVVFKELNRELADAGMARVTRLLDDMVAKRRLSKSEYDAALARVQATNNFEDMADCDLVIEAVVEKMDVKRAVFASLAAVLKPHAVIVSNTSALSIGEMAAATSRPDRVAGLHFFNPVHRMDLVEVVRAKDTSDDTVMMLLKLVKTLGKTPIVTSDSPGFLVNRVLFPYIGEAVRMVMEGHSPRELDREIKKFGMPMGPIELVDHVGLDVAWHVAGTLEHVLPESGDVIRFLGNMVARGWMGKKSGRGFYDYIEGKRGDAADLSALLSSAHVPTENKPGGVRPFEDSDVQRPNIGAFLDDRLSDIQRRLVYPMINEVGFCMQDEVVAKSWMADLAMILGTGFAPFRGGPMTLAESIGPQTLRNNLNVLAARHGERFKPSAWLVAAGRPSRETNSQQRQEGVNGTV
ncbi:3-hydroxyacyl-CoA dehydrogenase NAD-binding domain-containing protein [Fuerstiella marisgermanici]|uniref:enoyl-CoA hydratase n=1 Tax=Fuerstiella marisgermanici TaxID=1891926 RepID=A0A1P8W9A2_9PLAN|nr:3-hydroxyacyl-CoA dehydrogenase NAD-binding domain-containing protein [Fuerstiella marisgermanici]APZ90646.1 Fatty acid oxidation complex subunit alpha [Fuerstiella marisgermanici]